MVWRMRSPATAALPVLAVAKVEEVVADDRGEIREGDNVLLVIDDDPHYARVLLGLARDNGFKCIVANRGGAGIALAKQYLPTAITLDVFLPDMLGWTVLNDLKLDPATRHIPVQVLSVEEERQNGLSHGASYLVKPATTEDLEHAFDRLRSYVEPHRKRLLIVEDNEIERESTAKLEHDDIDVVAVGTAEAFNTSTPDSSTAASWICGPGHERPGCRAHPGRCHSRDIPVVVFTGKEPPPTKRSG
jgi:CheY-like chemotaxis protein